MQLNISEKSVSRQVKLVKKKMKDLGENISEASIHEMVAIVLHHKDWNTLIGRLKKQALENCMENPQPTPVPALAATAPSEVNTYSAPDKARLVGLACDLYQTTQRHFRIVDETLFPLMTGVLTGAEIHLSGFEPKTASIVIEMYRFFGVEASLQPGQDREDFFVAGAGALYDQHGDSLAISVYNPSAAKYRVERCSEEPILCIATPEDLRALRELAASSDLNSTTALIADTLAIKALDCKFRSTDPELKANPHCLHCQLSHRLTPNGCGEAPETVKAAAEALKVAAKVCCFLEGKQEVFQRHILLTADWVLGYRIAGHGRYLDFIELLKEDVTL